MDAIDSKDTSFEEKRAALATALGNKRIRALTQSFGFDHHSTVVSRAIVQRIIKFFEYTQKNLTKSCLSAKAAIATAVVDSDDEEEELSGIKVSDHQIQQLLNIPRNSALRVFKKARKLCALLSKGDRKGFTMLEKDK